MNTQKQLENAKAVLKFLEDRKITGPEAVAVLTTAAIAEEQATNAKAKLLAVAKVLGGGK